MLPVLLAAVLAVPVPRAALLDEAPAIATVARAERRPEPVRGVVEYVAGLGAMTLVNAGAVALLSESRFHLSPDGRLSLQGSEPALAGAAVVVALSPLAAALTSWLIGKGSPDWEPSLGWATAGAYGSSLLAIGAGLGLAAANVDRDAALAADAALYMAVPLGMVLLQNATKSPRP